MVGAQKNEDAAVGATRIGISMRSYLAARTTRQTIENHIKKQLHELKRYHAEIFSKSCSRKCDGRVVVTVSKTPYRC
jgi:hypothetical protein